LFAAPSPKLHDYIGRPNLLKLKMVLGTNKLRVSDCESCQLHNHI